jgi:hypothetical protein
MMASGFGSVEYLQMVAPSQDCCFSKRICSQSDAGWPNDPPSVGKPVMLQMQPISKLWRDRKLMISSDEIHVTRRLK